MSMPPSFTSWKLRGAFAIKIPLRYNGIQNRTQNNSYPWDIMWGCDSTHSLDTLLFVTGERHEWGVTRGMSWEGRFSVLSVSGHVLSKTKVGASVEQNWSTFFKCLVVDVIDGDLLLPENAWRGVLVSKWSSCSHSWELRLQRRANFISCWAKWKIAGG